MPLIELVYCVTVAFKMTERADQLHHDNAHAHSTALVQAFLTKHYITQVCQPPPYSRDLALCYFWLIPKLKSLLKGSPFVSIVLCITHIVLYNVKWEILKFETDSMSF